MIVDERAWKVYEKGYFATLREYWHRARQKGWKARFRFFVGVVLFTIGYAFFYGGMAVQETIMDVKMWLQKKF